MVANPYDAATGGRDASIAVLVACHNRRDKTLACLRALQASAGAAGQHTRLYLFDDGSTDGTAEAVRAADPAAVILRGDGTSFWNRGMHTVFAQALQRRHAAYLWLNDDTQLEREALQVLLQTLQSPGGGRAIVVGAVCDPATRAPTYGGSRCERPRTRPLRARPVVPSGQPERVDMMNGNVVLVPDAVARTLGNLDPVFEHAMGDTDYALRARRHGIAVWQTGCFVGRCARNPLQGTFQDRRASLRVRWRHVWSRKGLPLRSWWTFCRRHGGWLWPAIWAWGYGKVLLGRT